MLKNLPPNAGNAGSIPESGKSPGEKNGNPLQYSGLENPMDRETWQATVHGVTRVGHDLVNETTTTIVRVVAGAGLSFASLGCSGD